VNRLPNPLETKEQALDHLRRLLLPALVKAVELYAQDPAVFGEPTIGNEVFVDDQRYWEFFFSRPLLDSNPHHWLSDDGRLIFTQHAPPTDGSIPPEVFDAAIRAGRHALEESGKIVVLVPPIPAIDDD
jgi:hypothetical protein